MKKVLIYLNLFLYGGKNKFDFRCVDLNVYDFIWLNVLKEYLLWYWFMFEEFILLKGKLGLVKCINVLLIVLFLNDNFLIILCVMFLFLLKRYKFSGFDLFWMILSILLKLL